MFELMTLFLTGGGSAMMGSILKGVFGAINDGRQQKFELDLARECRGNEFALQFQQQLATGEGGMFARGTRRLLALIVMSTMSAVVILCTLYPDVELITLTNISGEGKTSIFFGLITFPQTQEPIRISLGHISMVFICIICPAITGFYFTPGGRR